MSKLDTYQDLMQYQSLCKEKAKVIISEENKLTHCANNLEQCVVRQYQLDGGIYPKGAADTRADYLVVNEKKQTAYIIELKKGKIEKGLRQLECSERELIDTLAGFQVFLRLIFGSATHNVMQSAMMIRYKQNHANFKARSSRMDENI